MKITVELDDATMAELVAVTGESKKGPAVAQAVEEFLKRKKARECGRLLMEGAFDYPVGDARGKGAAGPLSIQPLTGTNMALVDSSVWIEAARRQGDLATKVALRALLDECEAALCSPVKLEVLGGARRSGMQPRRWRGAGARRGICCLGMII